MEPTGESVDGFLEATDADGTLHRLDELVTSAMPGHPRVLWRGRFWGGTDQAIIGYGDLEQPRPGGTTVQWFVIGLARQKAHYSLYVNAVEDGAYLAHRYADRLGKVKLGAASIGFKRIDDVELEVLSELVTRAAELAG